MPGRSCGWSHQKFLEDRPVVEAWWSPHVFEGDRRKSERWQGAQAIAIDVDARVNGEKIKVAPWLDVIAQGWELGLLPGSIFHPTPHGFRLIFLLTEFVADRARYLRAVEGALLLARKGVEALEIDEVDLEVDEKVTRDLARLFWHPRAVVEGVVRNAPVYRQENEEGEAIVYALEALEAEASPAAPAGPPGPPGGPGGQ